MLLEHIACDIAINMAQVQCVDGNPKMHFIIPDLI